MYCKHCGAQMSNDAAFCTNCGVSAGSGSAYCQNCGAEVRTGAVFCSQCGVQFAPADPTYAQPAQETYSAPEYPTPESYMPPQGPYQPQPQAKSKIAAGILGILLGCFGVHNFYLGYTGKAIAQLCLSLLSCGVLSFASAIWGLVEGIMILTGSINTDANGIPLQD